MTISATAQGLRPGVCTSTSRPSAPFDGQVIYETDTNTLAVYDGSGWVSLNPVDRDRNVVINGAMQVAQRGTSTASITAGGYFTADRWTTTLSSLGTWTQSVENDAPSGSGFRKSLKMLCTTADASPSSNDELGITQIIEGQNLQKFKKGTSSAEKFTLSFWVKSNVTGTFIVWLYDPDNSRETSLSYTVSSSGVWEKKTLVFASDSTGAFDNDNAASLHVRFYLGAGSSLTSGTLPTTWATVNTANRAVGQTNLAAATNNYWQVTGVQLEVGAVATPFEFEEYGTTLAKCQRYYYRIDHNGNGRVIPAYMYSTTLAIAIADLPVEMRVAPSALSQSGTAGNYNVWYTNTRATCSSVPTFESATKNTVSTVFTVASGLTAGHGGAAGFETTAGFLAWSVEL